MKGIIKLSILIFLTSCIVIIAEENPCRSKYKSFGEDHPNFPVAGTIEIKDFVPYAMIGENFGYIEVNNKKVFRSSYLSFNPQCIEYLIKHENIKDVYNVAILSEMSRKHLNLYLMSIEQTIFVEQNIGYHKIDVMHNEEKFIEYIKIIANSKDNILVHCFGGIHRTGKVMGILQKCYNKVPIEEVIKEYKKHANNHPNIVRQSDIDFLTNFDCSKL